MVATNQKPTIDAQKTKEKNLNITPKKVISAQGERPKEMKRREKNYKNN